MRLLPVSAMYTLPDESTATPCGWFSVADVACPPSPLNEAALMPAIVEMRPVDLVTRRMLLLPESAMYRLPAASTATPCGALSAAFKGESPSPLYPAVPFPAIVYI